MTQATTRGEAADGSAASPVESLIRDLPKVELHVHLEGSLPPETLLELAAKHRVADIPGTLAEIRDWYAFRDFPHFIDVYLTSVRALRDEEDFARLARDVARRLAEQNVRYAEVHVSLYAHLMRGVPAHVVFAGIEEARREAERLHGLQLRWIPDFPGDFGVEAAEQTLDAVLRDGPGSVVGFGVGGIEVDRAPFADVFGRAVAAGLHSLPHAGENGGPERVWSALRDLRAERIGHGIDSMRDPRLVEHLAQTRIPVDVSPTSNVCTGAVATLEEHPLPAMLAAGLLVTLNTDDPPMFGTDLLGEYRAAHRLGLSGADLAGLARNGVSASFLPPEEKRALAAEIDAVLAAWSAGRAD
ncbi:adenosine deaminase [Marinitenerispora sediminis]|uniref:Adenosine deaminase n=1 Tax=Marinitenerispora sediminis TaxID=1931232 RepID=A0A368TEC0_9ACTN|nr:adenosine deaminase [Marinitenerispora sediminis]RCV53663.1 adenosine deaminase [Marinitenerispora sediminis]RCV57353.1 adenosine deaminase [Marinitenerispora sediminis]RCV62367.1 adenosine deaminase [Marinitenerispora sediminis]